MSLGEIEPLNGSFLFPLEFSTKPSDIEVIGSVHLDLLFFPLWVDAEAVRVFFPNKFNNKDKCCGVGVLASADINLKK